MILNKVVVLGVVAALSIGSLCAEESVASNMVDRAQALARRRANAKKTGGLLERPEVIPSSVISVVNAQKLIEISKLDDAIMSTRRLTKLPIEVGAKKRVAVTISLVDGDTFGSLCVCPEENAAFINVKKLASDGASETVLVSRVKKEIVRASLMVLGSGYSATKCYANPIQTLKELDLMEYPYVSPDTMMHLPNANRLGIRLISFVSYRMACQEGWAPAPVTDDQKQVWKEVHELPSKPMQIKFDPKSGK